MLLESACVKAVGRTLMKLSPEIGIVIFFVLYFLWLQLWPLHAFIANNCFSNLIRSSTPSSPSAPFFLFFFLSLSLKNFHTLSFCLFTYLATYAFSMICFLSRCLSVSLSVSLSPSLCFSLSPSPSLYLSVSLSLSFFLSLSLCLSFFSFSSFLYFAFSLTLTSWH